MTNKLPSVIQTEMSLSLLDLLITMTDEVLWYIQICALESGLQRIHSHLEGIVHSKKKKQRCL